MDSKIIHLFLLGLVTNITIASDFNIDAEKINGAKSNQEEWITHGRTYSEE